MASQTGGSSTPGGVTVRVSGQGLAYDRPPYQVLTVTVQRRGGQAPLVIVEWNGDEWQFEKRGRTLIQVGGKDVPGPVRGTRVQADVGRVES
ncbi:MAG: hypothetical protein ABEI98_05145 [Halorhabdus sp.]